MTANTYGRQIVVPLTNKSGGGVIAGDVVIVDTSNNDAFTTTTSAATTNIVGIAQETIASNATGRVLLGGYAALVLASGSVTRGNYGATHTVAKQAADVGASRVAGAFCKFLTGGTTPDAMVYNPDLGGASLTNPMTTKGDIIYAETGGTPTRLPAGTAGLFVQSQGSGNAPTYAAGITRTTLGTTTAGGSFATSRGIYMKKVTLATDGFLASIVAQVKGNGANSVGISAAVMSDNSGTPLSVIAVGTTLQKESDNSILTQLGMSTTTRAMTVAIGAWLAAGDYWLCVMLEAAADSRIQLAYTAGSSGDGRTQSSTVFADQSFVASSSDSNNYSIAANVLR